jgi:hypothetical protein
MALKRLDEEFDLKAGTQLLPYMKRLLPSLEARFQSVEATAKQYSELIEYIRAAAVLRMNEILIPATEDIINVTKLGFLLGPSSTLILGEIGIKYFFIDEGPQRDTFTPSPYVIIERVANHDDYGIARMLQYSQETGQLDLEITAWHGNPGPHSDWVISSTPGMADSTKLYHDAVGPMHDTVVDSTEQVRIMRDEIIAAAEALEEADLDVYNYVRRDGTVPFIAPQQGVNPPVGSNDANFATTSWSRARMIEYAGNALQRTGGTMTGPLTLAGPPGSPLHAATKAYVDSIIGQGGVINNSVTLQTFNPSLRLYPTGPSQLRQIEAVGQQGMGKWTMHLADNTPETGGDVGSNFALVRYGDSGSIIDTPLGISRQTGVTSVKGINSAADVNVIGDIWAYRLAAPTTGRLYLNQAKTAYHAFDGTNHLLVGGGLNCGPLTSGHINSLSIYTQGNAITTWGLTSHGQVTVNGAAVANALTVSSTGPMITMQDTDYGPHYVHAQQGNIGFLNYNQNWIQYTTVNGHIWSPAYGWMHDYINGQANAYAWQAADYRYNQLVSRNRWVHAGDLNFDWYYYQLGEIGHACVTGLWVVGLYYGGYASSVYQARYRQPQHMIAGGWYTSYWES